MRPFRVDTPTDDDRVAAQRALLQVAFENAAMRDDIVTDFPYAPPQTIFVDPTDERFYPSTLRAEDLKEKYKPRLTGTEFSDRIEEIYRLARESARKSGEQLSRHEPLSGTLDAIQSEELDRFHEEASFDVLPRDWFFYRRAWQVEAEARDRMEYVD